MNAVLAKLDLAASVPPPSSGVAAQSAFDRSFDVMLTQATELSPRSNTFAAPPRSPIEQPTDAPSTRPVPRETDNEPLRDASSAGHDETATPVREHEPEASSTEPEERSDESAVTDAVDDKATETERTDDEGQTTERGESDARPNIVATQSVVQLVEISEPAEARPQSEGESQTPRAQTAVQEQLPSEPRPTQPAQAPAKPAVQPAAEAATRPDTVELNAQELRPATGETRPNREAPPPQAEPAQPSRTAAATIDLVSDDAADRQQSQMHNGDQPPSDADRRPNANPSSRAMSDTIDLAARAEARASAEAPAQPPAPEPTQSAERGVMLDRPIVIESTPAAAGERTADAEPVRAADGQTNPIDRMTEIEPRQLTGQVLRGLRGVINQRGGNVTIRLNPPELGSLRIELQLNGGTVRASLQATSEAARALLTQDIGSLRQALESHGLTVDRLQVQHQANSGGADTATERDDDGSAAQGRSRGFFQHSGSHQDPDADHPDAKTHRPDFRQELLDLVA